MVHRFQIKSQVGGGVEGFLNMLGKMVYEKGDLVSMDV